MIKIEKFAISKKSYAFKPGTLEEEPHGDNGRGPYSRYAMDVFYYKKKDGRVMACLGTVWDYAPSNLSEEQFIAIYRSHYGPDPYAQWDGERFIGTQIYTDIVKYVEELKPILAAYPEIPDSYIGWYRNA